MDRNWMIFEVVKAAISSGKNPMFEGEEVGSPEELKQWAESVVDALGFCDKPEVAPAPERMYPIGFEVSTKLRPNEWIPHATHHSSAFPSSIINEVRAVMPEGWNFSIGYILPKYWEGLVNSPARIARPGEIWPIDVERMR